MKYAQQLITRMTWRSTSTLALVCCISFAVACPAQEGGKPEPRIRYVPLEKPIDSPPPIFKTAVIVDKMPLVHTRQLFPFDSAGTCESSSDKQIEQVLANLETVLKDSGSEMSKLIRVNVYALSTSIVTSFYQQLSNRLGANVRPAITSVLTPLPHRGVVIAVDAVAGAADSGEGVLLKRCKAVAGDDHVADAAVCPVGGIAYLSGHPEGFDLTTLPTTKSMTRLMKTLGQLNLAPEHVVQVKVFLNPITEAEAVLREVQTFFPDQLAPPTVFVEWLASMPVEIEMIAHLPPANGPGEAVQYFDPPDFRASNAFSRVALMRADRQIYIAGLYANQPSRSQRQADLLFGQLNDVLKRTGSDLRHLVKATYYVSDDDAARWVDRTRPKVFDPARPPAASKLMVHGVGHPQRTMTIDMIAVEAE
jgi:enamine deaminase RidA (YjgF/YER057c/UK114 family)